MIQELEKVAQLTREEAKRILTEEILDATRHEVAIQVRNLEQQAKAPRQYVVYRNRKQRRLDIFDLG